MSILIEISIKKVSEEGGVKETYEKFAGIKGAQEWMQAVYDDFCREETEEELKEKEAEDKELDADARFEGEKELREMFGPPIKYED